MTHTNRIMPSRVLKRSLSVGGRRTSVSLEDAFWLALREIAGTQKVSVFSLVTRIAKHRDNKNLSSAIRVFVLDHYRRVASNKHS